jgi:AraC-like DNA-binding protein
MARDATGVGTPALLGFFGYYSISNRHSIMLILNSHRLRMLTSSDPAETVRQMAPYLFGDYKISPVGRHGYLARVGGFKVGGFSFALIESNPPVIMEAQTDTNCYVLSSFLRGSADLRVDGKVMRMREGTGFVSRPRRVSASFSSDCIRLVVRLDGSVLRDLTLPDGGLFRLSNPAMAAWLGQVQGLLSCPSLMEAIGHDAGTCSHMERLLSALLRSGPDSSSEIERGTPIASRDVRRAEAFIRSHSQDDISLADIVAAAGVATRTLQNNFVRYRVMTPMQCLLRIRLEAARERLMAGDEASNVTNVALEAGFKHPSRFASFYRQQYGELPSATLRRYAATRTATRALTPATRVPGRTLLT